MPNGAVSVSPSSTTTSSAGMPSSWATIWAQVVSCPWPWVFAPVRRIAFPVMCTLSSAESNILMPRMSYSRLFPAPSGSGVGGMSRATAVDPVLVHAEVGRRGLDHPLLEEHRLGDPERAAVGDPAGGLVGVGPAGGDVA